MRPFHLLQLPLVLLLTACAAGPAIFEEGVDDYRVYRGEGSPVSLDTLYAGIREADITILGESHDDAMAHRLEEKILRETAEPGLALSLEMFETDVQLVLDEYLADTITEEQFLKDSRPWGNYADAYRPLIEFAREEGLPVIAANAPRRYVNLVGREGSRALENLSEGARAWLPPLPHSEASPAYREKFLQLMTRDMPTHTPPEDDAEATDSLEVTQDAAQPRDHAGAGHDVGPSADTGVGNEAAPLALERSLQAQSLWDATMAWSLARHLREHEDARVLHVNGSFHSEERLGIVEQLAHYAPDARVLVITILPSSGFPAFDADAMMDAGDFVIVTPPRRR